MLSAFSGSLIVIDWVDPQAELAWIEQHAGRVAIRRFALAPGIRYISLMASLQTGHKRHTPIQLAQGVQAEFGLASALFALAVGWALWRPRRLSLSLAALLGLLWALLLRFFRDPERTPDSNARYVVLSPADGRIVGIQPVHEPRFVAGDALKISIFMSILDVHVNRAPLAGTVRLVEHVPGRFLQAHRSEASLVNEHNWIGMEGPYGRVLVNQIAGIMARRIVCWVTPGQDVSQGERLGIIKFGSRVEVFLPITAEASIREGEQVYAGKTVIARLASAAPADHP
jgi:phosphatidylserine decarboxylase